jgi:hypothetical protein
MIPAGFVLAPPTKHTGRLRRLQLMSEHRSRLNACNTTEGWDLDYYRWVDRMQTRFLTRDHWRKSSQVGCAWCGHAAAKRWRRAWHIPAAFRASLAPTPAPSVTNPAHTHPSPAASGLC